MQRFGDEISVPLCQRYVDERLRSAGNALEREVPTEILFSGGGLPHSFPHQPPEEDRYVVTPS